MDALEVSNLRYGEEFQDATDEFPFYDCGESLDEQIESDAKPSTKNSTAGTLRRRRITTGGDFNSPTSPVSSATNYDGRSDNVVGYSEVLKQVEDNIVSSATNYDGPSDNVVGYSEVLKQVEDDIASSVTADTSEAKSHSSSGSVENCESKNLDGDPGVNSEVTSLEGNSDLRESSFLIALAGVVVKAVGFQFNLFVKFATFPIWLIYSSYMFIVDPFRLVRRGRDYLFRKVVRYSKKIVLDRSLLKLGVKFGWGFLWSVYVCVVLSGLLVSSFVVGGIFIKTVVVEPVRIRENLNFDYTEKSPTALVPVMGCPDKDFGVDYGGKFGAIRIIPLDHKLQATVSLKLPESDYNRNLGVFQVRVDFLAPGGKTLASSRRPVMLQFKSEPIRLLLTFLKVAPLLTGYSKESQDLTINFRGHMEGVIPTSCLRVTIEQRAEFAPAAGIPEIYAASLTLESEQPIIQRIIWWWRRTLFVWVSMTVFVVELLFALICCKSLIIPRVRTSAAENGASSQNRNGLLQRYHPPSLNCNTIGNVEPF